MTTLTLVRCAAAAVLLATGMPTHAAGPAAGAAAATDTVLTQATVQSRFAEDGGTRLYVRLKLQQIGHAPFTTLSYRVPDRATWERLQPREKLAFSAARIDGENTLTAVRILPR
jgi:Cu/Ag efflux protein CusF